MNRSFFTLLVASLGSLLLSHSAEACAMCTGSSDSPIAPAVNASIFLLMGVLLAVGGCFFKFVLYLASHDGLPVPGEPEINGAAHPQSSQQY